MVKFYPWDYLYYLNEKKQAKYGDIDETIRNYFKLNQVVSGVVRFHEQAFGITIELFELPADLERER